MQLLKQGNIMPAQEYPFAKALNNCFIYTKMGAYQTNSAMASVYS